MLKKDSTLEWGKVLAPVLSAIIVGAVGTYYTYQSAQNNNAKEYIKIAVGIINSPKSDHSDNMRVWAADLINHYSPVKFENELKKEIIEGVATPLRISSLFRDPLLKESVRYRFNWEHKDGHAYDLRVEQEVDGKWIFATGMSTPHSSIELLVPDKVKLRWKVTSYQVNGDVKLTSSWKQIDLR
ncbi:hypothetical protein V4V53_003961 [Vibrio mimicus]